MHSVMEFLQSFGSRTPHESKVNNNSSVLFEVPEDSRPNSSLPVRTPVDDVDIELAESSQVEIGSSVSGESRRDFLSNPATTSRTTFVPIDDLPLNFNIQDSGRTNPI
jgi:hypothetical protein